MSEVKVFYFSVADANAKIQILTKIVTAHFLKKEKIQILVPDLKTLTFVDSLLWKEPRESFLPHSVQTEDFITISTETTDLCPIIFNLCPTPCPSTEMLKTLYELEDVSHPQKKMIFQQKFAEYQKKGWILCSQPTGK
ncbi:MAG: DNA polymerase III subunit chi [Rhabdochlamydiaceae bacterium]|nr:DNA polymerase III subunit chi [Rhabdochlamydiaceae bacterium]